MPSAAPWNVRGSNGRRGRRIEAHLVWPRTRPLRFAVRGRALRSGPARDGRGRRGRYLLAARSVFGIAFRSLNQQERRRKIS